MRPADKYQSSSLYVLLIFTIAFPKFSLFYRLLLTTVISRLQYQLQNKKCSKKSVLSRLNNLYENVQTLMFIAIFHYDYLIQRNNLSRSIVDLLIFESEKEVIGEHYPPSG